MSTSAVAPTSLLTPATTLDIDNRSETPLPVTTPTAIVFPTSDIPATTPVPPKSPTASPTVQRNTPTIRLTQPPIPTILIDTDRTPDVCPAPILASSIVQRDNDTGWRHYWASSSQKIGVNDLLVDGKWLWIATTDGVIRLNLHTIDIGILFLLTEIKMVVKKTRTNRARAHTNRVLWNRIIYNKRNIRVRVIVCKHGSTIELKGLAIHAGPSSVF